MYWLIFNYVGSNILCQCCPCEGLVTKGARASAKLVLAEFWFVLFRETLSVCWGIYQSSLKEGLVAILCTFVIPIRPWQNGRHFTDNIFKCIFLNENVWISIKISLKCVPKDPINNIPALVQIMAWHRTGDKPLSEPMSLSLIGLIATSCVWWKGWGNSA